MTPAASAAAHKDVSLDRSSMRIGPREGGRSLVDALAEWQASRQNDACDPRYIAEVLATVQLYIQHAGIVNCDQITRESVRAWMGSFGEEIGPVTKRHRRNRLAMISRWLANNEYIATDPLAALERIRVKKRQSRIVPTEQDMARFILSTSRRPKTGDRWLCYILLATSNIRAHSTLAMLQPWMFHHEPENQVAYIDIPAECLKNGQDARVYLPRETALFLDAHTPSRADRWFAQLPKWDRFEMDREFAGFPKKNTPDGVKGATFSPHSLRHFASNRLRWVETFSPEERAKQNTHSDVSMTKRVYSTNLHPDYGKKIYRMQPLLPPEFAPPTRGKRKTICDKPLDKLTSFDDTDAAGQVNARLLARDSPTIRPAIAASAMHTSESTDGRASITSQHRVSGSTPYTRVCDPRHLTGVVLFLRRILKFVAIAYAAWGWAGGLGWPSFLSFMKGASMAYQLMMPASSVRRNEGMKSFKTPTSLPMTATRACWMGKA